MALFATLFMHLCDYWFVSVPLLTALGVFAWFMNQEEQGTSSTETAAPADDIQSRILDAKKSASSISRMKETVVFDRDWDANAEDNAHDEDIVPSGIPEDVQHIHFEHKRLTLESMYTRSKEFYELMNNRRSVRFFSKDPVPKEIIQNIVRTAGTAPSGAHTEPWRFIAVKDPEYKKRIRELVEQEEEINYTKRMGVQWTADVKGIGTSYVKEYLTDAPWILLVFKQVYTLLPDGQKRNNYYHEISTAISGGLLIAAIQTAGLVTLTSTPMNCGPALRTMFQRPKHEKLMLLLPVGYPSHDCTVPDFKRKELDEILTMIQ
uniref:Iodotyrosine deiodinase 1-like n=2 Tax=Hirondellea gigas TaxID=1518452 RepID=A0A2P2I2M4_9CRUS